MDRFFTCLFGIAIGLAFTAVPLQSAPRTTTIDGRGYMAVEDIAAAYGMKAMSKRKDSKEVGFAGNGHALMVKIDSRQGIIDGIRHWFSYPARKDARGTAYLSFLDVESTIKPTYDPRAAGKVPPVKTVVFDPGHGGHDHGSRSTYGREKDYALDVVGRARKVLESRGVKVVQTRLGDTFVNLSERPVMTKNYKDPIFVSIHFNSASWRPAASGFEIFALPPRGAPSTGGKPQPLKDSATSNGTPHEPASFVMANAIYNTLIGKMPLFDRGVKRSRFSVLRNARVPAVLIEGGFLTNPEEARNIHSPEWRQKYATAVADGIMAYMAYANKGTMPPRSVGLERTPTNEFVPED